MACRLLCQVQEAFVISARLQRAWMETVLHTETKRVVIHQDMATFEKEVSLQSTESFTHYIGTHTIPPPTVL